MPLDCRNQLTGTGRSEWCLLIYWWAFCCNQHLFRVCHDDHSQGQCELGSELLSQHPGSVWPGEGKCSLQRVWWLLWGWDWDWMLPGVPAWRQWWLHNETLNSQPRPSPVQSSHRVTLAALLRLPLACHTMSHSPLSWGLVLVTTSHWPWRMSCWLAHSAKTDTSH